MSVSPAVPHDTLGPKALKATKQPALPLTFCPPSGYWSQAEYVEVIRKGPGWGFATHCKNAESNWFHYRTPEGCASLEINGPRCGQIIHHDFEPGLGWIDQCIKAVGKVS